MRPGIPLLRSLLGRPRGGGGDGSAPTVEITGQVAGQLPGLRGQMFGGGTGIGGSVAGILPGLVGAAGSSPVTSARSRASMNIPWLTYYDSCVHGLDLGWQRSDWGYGGGENLALDANGWPRSVVAGSGQYAGFQARVLYPGPHVALYQGDGDISVDFGGSILSSAPGRYVLQLDGANDGDVINRVGILITRSNVSNPVRNLVVVPIANETDYATKLFNPRFMETLAPFGVLRMLDMQQINNIDRLGSSETTPDLSRAVTDWSTRTTAGYALQARRQGASNELLIDMCRLNNSHLWFQVPLFATTNWCDGMAGLCASYAPPWMHFFFAYGNEQWNDAFYNGGDAMRLGISRYGLPNEYDTRFGYQAIMGRYMRQAMLNAGIAPSRLHHVLESQVGYVLRNEILRDWQYTVGPFTDGTRAWQYADFMAVAPYFGHDRGDNPLTMSETIPQTIARIAAEDIPPVIADFQASVAAAAVHNLPMACYEGGQHLYNSDFGNTALQARLNDINRHANMYGLLYNWLNSVHASSVRSSGPNGPIVAYHHAGDFSQWGRWGWMEDIRQIINAVPRQCPKMDALVQWNLDHVGT
jgi:hypothetical protein